MSFALEIDYLNVAYGDRKVLHDVCAEFPVGTLTAVVGPNGAGKSTLIKAALGLVPRLAGEVKAFGKPFGGSHRSVAYVPQRESVDWDFPVTVWDVVMMGTYADAGWLRRLGRKQHEAAQEALAAVELQGLEARQISQLSGGQQQRLFIARALAQGAELYLMDEPFAGVDAATERAIVRTLKALRDQGKTIVAVHHDLESVPEIFDRVVLLNRHVVAEGPIETTFTPDNLRHTYGGRLVSSAV